MNQIHDIFEDEEQTGKLRIMRHALRLFAEKGLSATSIRDIAAAAGLSNPALYKHFKSKDELAQTLFQQAYQSHVSHLVKAVQKEEGFTHKFKAYLRSYLQAYDAQPHAMMFATDVLPTLWPLMPDDVKRHTALTELRAILLLGQSEGHVSKNEDLNLQMALVVGTLVQLSRQIFQGVLKGLALDQLEGTERLLRAALK